MLTLIRRTIIYLCFGAALGLVAGPVLASVCAGLYLYGDLFLAAIMRTYDVQTLAGMVMQTALPEAEGVGVLLVTGAVFGCWLGAMSGLCYSARYINA